MSDARPFSPTPGFQVFLDEFRLRKAGNKKLGEAELLAQAQREWASRTGDPIGGARWAQQYEGEAQRRLTAPGGAPVESGTEASTGQAAPVPLKSQINRESVGQFGSRPSLIERSADAQLKKRFGGQTSPESETEGPFNNNKIEAPSMALLPASKASAQPAPVALRSQQAPAPKPRMQLTAEEKESGASVSYEPTGPAGTASYTDRFGNDAGSDKEGEFAIVQGRRLRGDDYAKYTQNRQSTMKQYDSAVTAGKGNYEEGRFQQTYAANLKTPNATNARAIVGAAADRAPGMPGARSGGAVAQDSEQFRARLTAPRAAAGRRNRTAVAL